MNQELWTAVDHYLIEKLVPHDSVLDETLRTSEAAGLPAIGVAPNQGKLLYLLARIRAAERILEIGTLGGYSTTWLGRALPPHGKLVTLEMDPKHAEVASANIARAGLAFLVDLRVGPALDSLAKLRTEGVPAFDFVFIDADKRNNPAYVEWALRFSRPGTIIVVDNIVRDGAVIEPDSTDPSVQGTRGFIEILSASPRVEATAIQTVGVKGYDGLVLAVVTK